MTDPNESKPAELASQADSQADTQQEPQPDTQVAPQADAQPDVQADAQADVKADPGLESQRQAQREAQLVAERDAKRQADLDKEVNDALGGASIEQIMDGTAAPGAAKPSAGEASGKRRTGTVVAVRGEDVFVEFGGKDQGACPILAFPKAKAPRVGERMEFIVERYDESEGLFILKVSGAMGKAVWDELEVGSEIEALVVSLNTGGLELKVEGTKVKAFMPASQVDLNRVEDFSPFINRKLKCRVIELNRAKKKILVSRKVLLKEESDIKKGEVYGHIQVGEERSGKVVRLQDFGAFVEIEPGVDGLLHVSDISHARINSPKDVLKEGQVVKVKVLKVNAKQQKISLGMKQLEPSPWDKIDEKYPVDSEQSGTVTRIMDFGCFVELEPGVEGLIHISQLSESRVHKVEHEVKVGQKVTFKVTSVQPSDERIGLSIRALTVKEETQGEASKAEVKNYVKKADDAKAMASLMSKFGGEEGLKGGIG